MTCFPCSVFAAPSPLSFALTNNLINCNLYALNFTQYATDAFSSATWFLLVSLLRLMENFFPCIARLCLAVLFPGDLYSSLCLKRANSSYLILSSTRIILSSTYPAPSGGSPKF